MACRSCISSAFFGSVQTAPQMPHMFRGPYAPEGRLALKILQELASPDRVIAFEARMGLSFIVDDNVFVDPNDVSTMVRSDFVRIHPAGMVAICLPPRTQCQASLKRLTHFRARA